MVPTLNGYRRSIKEPDLSRRPEGQVYRVFRPIRPRHIGLDVDAVVASDGENIYAVPSVSRASGSAQRGQSARDIALPALDDLNPGLPQAFGGYARSRTGLIGL